MHLRLVEKVHPILYCFCRKLLNTMEWLKLGLYFPQQRFTWLWGAEILSQIIEKFIKQIISTGCQCKCQSLTLDSSKRGTRYKTGRLTAQGDTEGTMITMVMVMVDDGGQHDDYQSWIMIIILTMMEHRHVLAIRGGRAKLHKIKRDGGQIAQPRSQTNENLKIH